jgi:IclR family KDG regulon transcriptional repressor
LPSRDKDSYSIQSVENALDVLEALCDEEGEVRISHLSERLNMNKTSVFRLLATFEGRGYVEKEESSGKYRLGLTAYEVGQKLLSRMELLKQARPVMERLVRDCNEATYITVRRGDEILFLDMVDTTQKVKIVSLIGKRFPLHTTAAGRAILAFSKQSHSVADQQAIEYETIRKQGYAVDTDMLGEDIFSIACPLFCSGGSLNGALCVVGPAFRIKAESFTALIQEASAVISSKLGDHTSYRNGSNFSG